MIVFLTGEIQIGKSTVISKILKGILKEKTIGGFFTKCIGDDVFIFNPEDYLYSDYSKLSLIGTKIGRRKQTGYTEVFDTKGVMILEEGKSRDLLIMDEIGWMESKAEAFSNNIIELCEEKKNILGVLRENANGILPEYIRNNKNIKLITVTKENRDSLVSELMKYY